MSIVNRPVHQGVKLCDIEDTSLLDDITTVRNAMKKNVIDERKVNLEKSRTRRKINSVEDLQEESIKIENSPPQTNLPS